MDIRQIRYLISAVDGGSLSAAAKQQFVTVQAVSKAISELEDELGFQLLTRGNRGVVPTAVGSAFYRRGKDILTGFDDLNEFSKGFPAEKSPGRLAICLCSPQFNNDHVALGNLTALIESNLNLKVDVISATGEQSLEALRSRAVDAVATIGEYSSPDTDSIPIGNMPSGIVLSTRHPLAKGRTVRIDDLAPYPVLRADKWDSFNRSILETYLSRGLRSDIVRYDVSLDINRFFQQQLGGIFAVHLPMFRMTNPDTLNLPIDPADAAHIPLCLVTLKSYKTPAYLKLERNASRIFRSGQIL